MSKHTPGPWFVSRKVGGLYVEVPHRAIAEVRLDANPIEPSGVDNARLISAAPDMLEALEALCNGRAVGGEWVDMDEAINIGRAAIAKATGDAA